MRNTKNANLEVIQLLNSIPKVCSEIGNLLVFHCNRWAMVHFPEDKVKTDHCLTWISLTQSMTAPPHLGCGWLLGPLFLIRVLGVNTHLTGLLWARRDATSSMDAVVTPPCVTVCVRAVPKAKTFERSPSNWTVLRDSEKNWTQEVNTLSFNSG